METMRVATDVPRAVQRTARSSFMNNRRKTPTIGMKTVIVSMGYDTWLKMKSVISRSNPYFM